MATSPRRNKRVTIKIHRAVFEQLKQLRKDTGAPISVLMAQAVARYAAPRPGVKRTRIRKLCVSR